MFFGYIVFFLTKGRKSRDGKEKAHRHALGIEDKPLGN